jgi:hypothetical protein
MQFLVAASKQISPEEMVQILSLAKVREFFVISLYVIINFFSLL